jgi:AraC-like DNA-binding protein
MNFAIDWLNVVRVVSILGAVQGFILFLLLFQKRKNKSMFYLSFFLLSFSFFIGTYAEPTFELYLSYPYLPVLLDFLPFFQTPMVYLYFYHTIFKDKRQRFPVIIHLLPAILDIVLVHAWYLTGDSENFREILYQSFFESPHPVVWVSSLAKYTSGIIYSVLILGIIYGFKQKYSFSSKNRQQQKWLFAGAFAHAFCWLLVIITGIVIYNYKMDHSIVKAFILFELVSFTITMYIIAFFAFRYPNLFPEVQARSKIAQKLNLDNEKFSYIERQLENLMKRKFHYLDETASLQSTAKRLGIHANVLSYIVNEKFGKNFSEYINDLRLDHFIGLLKIDNGSTLLRLAFDSGFASKTTFNLSFKKRFNIAPGEYLNPRKI